MYKKSLNLQGPVLGFTLLELLFGLSVISIVLVGALILVRSSAGSINKLRQETVAINLARESMEGVYTRRNTNRLQHPSEKDSYWLCVNNSCTSWIHGGNTTYTPYKINYTSGGVELTELELTSEGGQITLDSSTQSIKTPSTLITGNDSAMLDHSPNGGKFYRAILAQGLYQKDVNLSGGSYISSCTQRTQNYTKLNADGSVGSSVSCGDSTPKEFRFCSKVEYEGAGAGNGNVVLCGALTNYAE